MSGINSSSPVVKIILLLPVTIAFSILIELISWFSLRGGYETHLFTNNLLLWSAKHVLIGLGISFFLWLRSQEQIRPFTRRLLFLFSVLLLTLAAQIGFTGTWFCDFNCEGLIGIVIPFSFAKVALVSAGVLALLGLLRSKMPRVVLVLLTIISIIFIALALMRPYEQNKIAKSYLFVTDSIDSSLKNIGNRERYVSTHATDINGIQASQWEQACSEYERLSFGSVVYGNAAAANCFVKGALLYKDAQMCKHVSVNGGAFRLDNQNCLQLVAPVAQSGTLPQDKIIPTNPRYTFTPSSTDPYVIVVTGASNKEQLKEAETIYIQQHYPNAIIQETLRGTGSKGQYKFVSDRVAIIIRETGEKILVEFEANNNEGQFK